jgi:lysophospholipase L1-like esterase
MTVSSNLNKKTYIGNGTTKVFDYDFDVLSEDDLHLYLTNITTGIQKEIMANYSISPSSGVFPSSSGTITYPTIGTAITSNYKFTIIRTMEVEQPTVYPNNTALKPKVVEKSFDRITMIAQQQQEQISRSLTHSVSIDPNVSNELPYPVPNMAIGWNETGEKLVNVDPGTFPLSDYTATAKVADIITKGPLVDVRAFGVIGDGVTDDTVKFNSAIAYANANNKLLFIPYGAYNINKSLIETFDSSKIIIDPNATFYDSDSTAYFRADLPNTIPNYLFYPYKSKYNLAIRTNSPKVVCYGDSNTYGYWGDTGQGFDPQISYITYAELVSMDYANITGATFIRNGYPGLGSAYGLDNFDTVVAVQNPDVVVFGWGTNDVRPDAGVLSYIENMEIMITKTLSINAFPIVMSIPDYCDTYAGPGDVGLQARARVKVWNTYLLNLCNKYNVPFLDTYTLFNSYKKDEASLWYNDVASGWRHFSVYANQVIAQKLCEIMSKYSTYQNVHNNHKFSIGKTDNDLACSMGIIEEEQPNDGNAYSFKTLNIPVGEKIRFRVRGDIFAINFMTRLAAGIASVAILDTSNVLITTLTLDCYGGRERKKLVYKMPNNYKDVIVEITASGNKNSSSAGTTIYIAGLSAQQFVSIKNDFYINTTDYNVINNAIQNIGGIIYNDADLTLYYKTAGLGVYQVQSIHASSGRPSSPTQGMMFFSTDLNKPIWCKSVSPNIWVDATGAVI